MLLACFRFCQQREAGVGYVGVMVHVACDTRVSVDPPCTTDARLSFKEAELVKSFFLQTGSKRNGGFARPDDQDRIIGVCIFGKAVNNANGVRW